MQGFLWTRPIIEATFAWCYGFGMNCKECKFFYITWDKKFPYGCKLYEIKSKTAPDAQVLINTGVACLGYEPKITPNS
jgi:hypothetical protein